MEECERDDIGDPYPPQFAPADRMRAARTVVDHEFGIKACVADLGEAKEKITIFARDEIFAQTIDLVECAASYDHDLAARFAFAEEIVLDAKDEIEDSE